MFDSYFERDGDKCILTKPFIETDDMLGVRSTVQDYLCKIREMRSEELVILYSGGIDSSFLLLCYQDCIKQGRLSIDDYEIISFDFLPQDQPDKIKYWFAETYLSSLNINYVPLILDSKFIINLFRLLRTFTLRPWQFGVNVQSYCYSLFPTKTFIIWDLGPRINFIMGVAGMSNKENNTNVLNLPSYYECAKSSWVKNCYLSFTAAPEEVIEIDPQIASRSYYYKVPKWQFFMCYPELYTLWPKRLTLYNVSEKHQKRLYKFYYDFIDKSNLPFVAERNYVDFSFPIHLPNGDRVTSVEQTQEFFNRHS
tara:strand:- start:3 stop:932 length:930 start_codon:yes stop_codon:yes gene_type:complete